LSEQGRNAALGLRERQRQIEVEPDGAIARDGEQLIGIGFPTGRFGQTGNRLKPPRLDEPQNPRADRGRLSVIIGA